MALFQDKRKPVDIYAKGSPTEKAQQVTSNAATAPIRAAGNVAFAPAKALMKNVVAPAAQAAVQPLVDASKRNQRFMTQQAGKVTGNAANREADALLYGSGEKQVGGTGTFSPVEARKGLGKPPVQPTTATPQRDGIQSQRIDPTTASSFRRAVTPPVSPYTEAANEAMRPTRTVYTNSGDNITAEQQPMRLGNPAAMSRPTPGDAPRAQVGNSRRLSMNQKAGNLDIQFEPGTDEQSIRRFMENPIRPTAAIDRYNARYGPSANQDQMSQGQRASMNASTILGPNNNREKPVVGWKERSRLNEQMLQNQQAERNAQIQAGASRDSNANQFNIARMGANVNADRNNIDRIKAESDAAVNNAAVAGSQFDLGRKQQIDTIRKKYATAPEGPEREALGRQLTGMGEPVDPAKSYQLEQGKLRAQEEKTRVEEGKVTMQSLSGLGPDERRSTLISMYDPDAPQDQVQRESKAAVQAQGKIVAEDFEQRDGLLSNPLPEILEMHFPPGIDPRVAIEILENIPNKKLRNEIGRALATR